MKPGRRKPKEKRTAQKRRAAPASDLRAQLRDAREQQAATSDILRLINESRTDVQRVFDSIAEHSLRLLHGFSVVVSRVHGDRLEPLGVRGGLPDSASGVKARIAQIPRQRGTFLWDAIIDRTVTEIADVDDPGVEARIRAGAAERGWRANLAVPILHGGEAIGVISVSRVDPGRFSAEQIELLETFAAQAVIAIENARLFTELQAKNRAMTESLEQQTATSDILRVISNSPTSVQPVFNAIAVAATTLCASENAGVFLFDGTLIHFAAHHNWTTKDLDAIRQSFPRPPGRGTVTARAILTRDVAHVSDITTESGYELRGFVAEGFHAILSVPMLKDSEPIGAISVTRREAKPFTDTQIALLQTFADQAVIAIENVRLFTELQEKNTALTEALDQQTATADVLRIIAQSPAELPPVLDAIAKAAVRLCAASDAVIERLEGDRFYNAAHAGMQMSGLVGLPLPLTRHFPGGRAVLDRKPIIIDDLHLIAEDEYPDTLELLRLNTIHSVAEIPLLSEGKPLGTIAVLRREIRPFTDAEVALLKTFADQAVIAIENVRLFTELQQKNRALTESLDQQTATSEILRVISSSPTDVQPVFDAIVGSAVRLCDGFFGVVTRYDGHLARVVAHHNMPPDAVTTLQHIFERPPTAATAAGRVLLSGVVLHTDDLTKDTDSPAGARVAEVGGFHATVVVPMLREGTTIGTISVARRERQPFSEAEIALLQTFADQAVIAIENVRLFTELQEKNRAVTEALEQQTATAEILRVISQSPADLQSVFDAMVDSAMRLFRAWSGNVCRFDGELVHLVASRGAPGEAIRGRFPTRPTAGLTVGRCILDRAVIQIDDVEKEGGLVEATREMAGARGWRSALAVPMLRDGEPVGAIMVTRKAPGGFADDELELLKTFADQAVIAIENARLLGELQARTADLSRSVDQLTALGEVSRAVSSTLDLDRVLNTVVLRASQLASADGCSIFEYDSSARGFRMRATSQVEPTALDARRTALVPSGEGAVGRLIETRAPVQIPDISSAEAYRSPLRDSLIAGGFRALLAVPMIQEDDVVGGLVVSRKAPGEFPAETVELLRTFANQSALAIANARLFREIEEKSAQLEVANQHKSEFLANMSHELRTPLNAVIGFSDVLLEGMFGDINEKQTEYLRDILSSGTHLLSLINDILDLAKIEAGRMELDLSDFDVPSAIGNALTLMRERATRHGIVLSHVIDDRLGEIRADERKFKQVLLNLLSNAVKFTPEGGKVEVRARLVDAAVEVAVADTGEGIAPEDQQAVFEEFRQVGKSSKKIEGTGLGLALCRKFVELHGGTLGLESQVGVGSTFTFTMPVRSSNQ